MSSLSVASPTQLWSCAWGQHTRVPSLIREDRTCHRATKPMHPTKSPMPQAAMALARLPELVAKATEDHRSSCSFSALFSNCLLPVLWMELCPPPNPYAEAIIPNVIHSAKSKLQLSAMQEKHDDSHKFKLLMIFAIFYFILRRFVILLRHTEKSSDLKKLICILCYRVFLITSDYILANSKVDLKDNSLEESCGGLPPVEEGDRKISLIMELSTQVSLQTEKITQLEEVLEEKERKIQQLEAEREAHCFPEVKDSPECLQETPISL
ncbi:hypothetical protein FD754_008942 [Muntiacus muntjak]|uniref:Uncharacterized protein n=1 Tax=Muntiacus muntjak TaxID=9888 RepID=A0A5N3WX54_MUNMU|nr:hypothetical protein FD754_008942 [Muntiacus muntjak]